ncbi:hypothetical protein GCM10023165_25690 [Variovorax defluvii]|uniref:Uncharacterized protein n=1 Tax=Variovorax defluvii TaxID=913761 RepID=A0ABP8HRR4_9BURK
MKTLEMPAAQRNALVEHHALAVDARGEEVLQGLNPEESRFFVACMLQEPMRPEAQERFAQLHVQHEAARLRLARVDDESSGEAPERPPRLAPKF